MDLAKDLCLSHLIQLGSMQLASGIAIGTSAKVLIPAYSTLVVVNLIA
jgi:hypothetical protein